MMVAAAFARISAINDVRFFLRRAGFNDAIMHLARRVG
jgi:hypothetical protein